MSIGTYQVTSSDALAGPAKAVRVHSVVVKSTSTAAVVLLKNGATGGTEMASINGTISQSVTVNYSGGMIFPLGCFVDLDTNTAYVTVQLEVLA